MTINEPLPLVANFFRAEKFRLVQIVLQQMAAEKGIADSALRENDQKSLRGALSSYANPELMEQEHDTWPATDKE